ncbi:uncharacterized protein [Parasteatoda tepidariorum]|uniref:uncharacterized protein n=1 Tax=Parasteatoda tepidariorum TaxID=114398 RepID=UPI001C71846A|nr:uncharacterized protein LOC107447408 [Parasteatoda tepidariorum]XP_015917803.2 uncharacterized protein LOC107447408 [Parasteatoda tepidariorum]XP_015917805.2 uncharacterized protein LOC107447408 [Parasteatoda tepidariorum]
MDLEKKVKENWVVAFSCCFINFLLYGVARLSGMMMVAVSEAFQTNRASASLPFSVSTSVRNLSGFFVGYMGQRFGLRPTIAMGCGLSSLGAALCLFVTDIRWMVVCWGGIFGIGFGLATCLLPLAINQSFSRYRGIASGISYSGSYIGSFVFPSLVVALLNEYGISGALLVISGTFLNGCAVAFLLREPTKKTFSIPGKENTNKLYIQLWRKMKCLFRALKKQKFEIISNYSSIYCISPRPVNILMRDDSAINNKSCCELISYKNSSTKQISKSYFLDCNRYPRCSSNKSIWYYFQTRMKKAKYKRKITRIKFSLATAITKKRFSFHKQLFHFPIEDAKLVSFKIRKLSLVCVKVRANKFTETRNDSNLHNHPSNSAHPQFSKIVHADECSSERKHFSHRIDIEPFFSKEEKNKHFEVATDETQCLSKGDDKLTDIEPEYSKERTRSLLKDTGRCLFGWSRLYADPMFVLIAVTMSLHTFVVVCMITIIEDFAKDVGIPECQVHYVLMVLSIADLIGSLTLGLITDRGFLSSYNFIILCFFGQFCSQICISYCRRFQTLLSVVAVCGIFESGIIITFPLLIAHFIPKKKQAVAVASSNILSSPTVLLVPLIIGYFRDMKGCYSGAFYSLGLTSLSCCCAWLLASCTFIKYKSVTKNCK